MSKKTRDKKNMKEDSIIVNINIGNEVEAEFKKKIHIDSDGFTGKEKEDEESSVDGYLVYGSCNHNTDPEDTYPEHPESAPCDDGYNDSSVDVHTSIPPVQHLSDIPVEDLSDVPEEERIIDDGDPIIQTVIEMCKRFGIDRTIESLQKIENKQPKTYAGLKAARIGKYLKFVKNKFSRNGKGFNIFKKV